jgi:hypothetical protein
MAEAPPLRLATYNVEWFNALFDDRGRLLDDGAPSARYKTSRHAQLDALGHVFRALDADGVLVIEAPDDSARRSCAKALESFARHFGLRACRALTGFRSETEQEIAFMYDPDRLHPRHDPLGPAPGHSRPGDVPRFDGSFHYDLDADALSEVIRFSKPPLELALGLANGRVLRLIGVHAKSKAPHGVSTKDEVTRISIENRRKQLAQCIWVRARVEEHLRAGDDLVVLGDFNDGPGLDAYERLFGHSGVEIVLGHAAEPEMRLLDPHARMALAQRVGTVPTTARFWFQPQKRYFEALLDFIMVSPGLAARAPNRRIWHPFDDPALAADPVLREALLAASDHFPVSIDLALPSWS